MLITILMVDDGDVNGNQSKGAGRGVRATALIAAMGLVIAAIKVSLYCILIDSCHTPPAIRRGRAPPLPPAVQANPCRTDYASRARGSDPMPCAAVLAEALTAFFRCPSPHSSADGGPLGGHCWAGSHHRRAEGFEVRRLELHFQQVVSPGSTRYKNT